ncbi:winged helix-turn-helix domain-containing protein [Novosphingobium rosa]|uniref:winged helix-turn-helix domain-containing protein n=1 Tax=Novosphingobium rosa TaxID=76978 RepID=UPI001C3F705D|nr:winged helix-turn-helix domain-containing protein [Novosphingobium rosa]
MILRRVERFAPRQEEPARLHFAGWTLDTKRNLLLGNVNSDPIVLGGVDVVTLRSMLGEPYRTLSRDHLSQRIYGREHDPADRAIDMSISRLRLLAAPGFAPHLSDALPREVRDSRDRARIAPLPAKSGRQCAALCGQGADPWLGRRASLARLRRRRVAHCLWPTVPRVG